MNVKWKRVLPVMTSIGVSLLFSSCLISSASATEVTPLGKSVVSTSSDIFTSEKVVASPSGPKFSLLKDDKDKDSKGKDSKDSKKDSKDSKEETTEKEDKEAILGANMKVIMDAAGGAEGKIDAGGLLYGPIESNSGIGKANLMYSAPALGRENAKMIDDGYGHHVLEPYISFGYGLSKLRDAGFKDTSSSSADELDAGVGEFANVFASLSKTSLLFLRKFSPLPLIMSIYDNSYLTNGKYNGGKDGNQLLDLVRKQPALYDFFNAMGSPMSSVPGLSMFSFTQFLGIMTALGTVFFGLAMHFFGHNFGETIRKVLVGLFVTVLGVPLAVSFLDSAMNMMTDAVVAESKSPKIEIASNNLLFADWAETGFSMPEGASFTVQDGDVKISKNDVLSINKHVEGLLGRGTSEDAIAKRIKSEMKSGNNVATVAFKEAIKKDGTKWDTDKLVEAAQKFAKNEEIDPDDVDSIGYLNAGTITKSGSEASWTFNGHGGRWGVSPLTAVNVLSGTFDANGYTVGDMNTQAPKIPHVVADIDSKGFTDSASDSMPGLVKGFLAFMTMYALIKTLMTIIYSAYGGFLKGGLTAAIGSPRGFGELIGSTFGLVLGVVGISGIGALVLTLGDVIWQFIVGNGFKIDNGVLKPLIDAVKDAVESIPLVGKLLSKPLASATSFIFSLIACMFVPKVAKMPIEQFGGFCSSLPSRFGELFQNFANRITGDYRGGSFFGGSSYGGNNITHAVDNAMNSSISNLKMASAGAGLMAGATVAMAGRSLEKRLTNNNNTSDHDKDSEYDKSDDETTRDVATTDSQEKNNIQATNTVLSENSVSPEESPVPHDGVPVQPLASEEDSGPVSVGESSEDTPEEIGKPDDVAAQEALEADAAKVAEAEALGGKPEQNPVAGPQVDPKVDASPKDGHDPKASADGKDGRDPKASADGKDSHDPKVSVDGKDGHDGKPEVTNDVSPEAISKGTELPGQVGDLAESPVETPVNIPTSDNQSVMGSDVTSEGVTPAIPEVSPEYTQNSEVVNTQANVTDGSMMNATSSYADGGQTMSVQSDTQVESNVEQSAIDAGIANSSMDTRAETNLSATKVDGDHISQGTGQGQSQGTDQGSGQGSGQGQGQGQGQGTGRGIGQSGQSSKSLRSALANAASSPLRMAQSGGQSLKSGLKAHAAKHEGGKVDQSIQAYRMAKTKDGRRDIARGSGLALARSMQAAGGHATFGDFVKGATHVTASMAGHGDMTHRWATKNRQTRQEALRPGQAPQTPEQLQAQQPMTKNQQELRLEEMMGHYNDPSGYGN